MVPVLSKQQMSTRPANGIRNGSVQKMAAFSVSEMRGLGGVRRRTVLGESDEGGVDGERELHGQLGRDDRGDDDDTVE